MHARCGYMVVTFDVSSCAAVAPNRLASFLLGVSVSQGLCKPIERAKDSGLAGAWGERGFIRDCGTASGKVVAGERERAYNVPSPRLGQL